MIKRLCVFCGSSSGSSPAYREAAERLGRILLERGIGLVYGGGDVGLMGVLADTVLASGGEVIGVITRFLVEREVAHRGLTELRIVESMHERKAVMTEWSDAFVALPGGLGTMDEAFEALTWKQLDLHRKPVGLLNVRGYYDHLVRQLDHFVVEGFLSATNRELLIVDDDPARLLERIDEHRSEAAQKPFDRRAS